MYVKRFYSIQYGRQIIVTPHKKYDYINKVYSTKNLDRYTLAIHVKVNSINKDRDV